MIYNQGYETNYYGPVLTKLYNLSVQDINFCSITTYYIHYHLTNDLALNQRGGLMMQKGACR